MVTTSDILSFASSRKFFTRKELIFHLEQEAKLSSPRSLSEQLHRLLKSVQIKRVDRGVYTFLQDTRRSFSVVSSEETLFLHQQLKTQFPFLDICIWSVSNLISYMHHIPNLSLLFVEVENDAVESVFNSL